MKPKEIYELETVEANHWVNEIAFAFFTEKELDEDLLNYEAASEDFRIETLCKAKGEGEDTEDNAECWIITFDKAPIGIVRIQGRHNQYWDRLITDYPKYQAMVSYVRYMFTPGDSEEIVDENEDVKDLEYIAGWTIDKDAFNNMRW